MDVEDVYKIFNSQLLELIDDVSAKFPEIKELSQAKSLVSLTTFATPSVALCTFQAEVLGRYGKHLREHDEAFFTDDGFARDAVTGGAFEGLVRVLQNAWSKGMGDASKQAMWKYIDNLVALCDHHSRLSGPRDSRT